MDSKSYQNSKLKENTKGNFHIVFVAPVSTFAEINEDNMHFLIHKRTHTVNRHTPDATGKKNMALAACM
jgi:hypothetical protein